MSPDVSIEKFFKDPVINRKWKIDRTHPFLVSFGLMWKVYDIVAVRGLDLMVPILESGPLLGKKSKYRPLRFL